MKILIKITKDVLRRSMMCKALHAATSSNCAIALAVRDLLPNMHIGFTHIHNSSDLCNGTAIIELPLVAQLFITKFDSLADYPEERLTLPEFSFELKLPADVIESISIGEVYRVLSESKTLELVSIK